MQNAAKIISMLEKITEKLDEHSQILGEHSQILGEHSQILREHSQMLREHSEKHDNHTATLKEHGQILSALRSGQEYLKAEQDGMKVSNVKEFGALKENMDKFTIHFDMLRDESWKNKADIQRVKNTLGMN